jgi:subtilisin family serine protease
MRRQQRLWLLFACFSLILLTSQISTCLPSTATDGISKVEVVTDNEQKGFNSTRLTLVTGDVIIVTELPGGQLGIGEVNPALSGTGRRLRRITNSKGTYVIPTDVNLDKLDIELFNVEYLLKEGYSNMKNLPIMVTTSSMDTQTERSMTKSIQDFGGHLKASFQGISTLALDLPMSALGTSIHNLIGQPYVKKIWLDKKVHACLSESVPLIGAPELWSAGYNGTGIQIAILDTGINGTHPDLDDLDDNPNTFDPKVIRKVNFSDDNTTDDLRGHGTHCAGIAAGTGAASGGKNKGVAPGAKLWNVKVLDKNGWGEESWVISGINYAAYGPDGIAHSGDEADVISMSLGGDPSDGNDPTSIAADKAVDLGVVVVVAAGNGANYLEISAPGDAKKVITVGASSKQDDLASFSSRGPTLDYRVKPDILAPGLSINSTYPGTATYYQVLSGTSMATPHVAGTAALLLQACKTLPTDLSLPTFIKDVLISTAKDLGYDVYTQGGGRIQVPYAAHTEIVADPATISFGNFPNYPAKEYAAVTFYNLNSTSSHDLTLNVSVFDTYGNRVNYARLNTTVLNIAPSSTASVLLTINTSGPPSIYSGRISAIVDGKDSISVIFGFTKLNRMTISLTPMYPEPYMPRYLDVIGDPGFPEHPWSYLYPSGNVTFYVIDGVYHVFSEGWDYNTDSPIWAGATNVSVTGNIDINLDERKTFKIDFNPNKQDQIMLHKSVVIYKANKFMLEDLSPLYPRTAISYVSQVSIDISFNYYYYPKAYFSSSEPETIDAPEWHNLVYGLGEISKNATFVADYNNLVQRTTDYKVSEIPQRSQIIQFASGPKTFYHGSPVLRVDVPKRRIEWLSPDPAYYCGFYCNDFDWRSDMFGWDFETSEIRPLKYPPKSKPYFAVGDHPFTLGPHLDFREGSFSIWGFLSADNFGNDFINATRVGLGLPSGDLTLFVNGIKFYYMAPRALFNLTVIYSGTPRFTIICRAFCDLAFSKNTTAELSFTGNRVQDCHPPTVKARVKGSDLGCRVPPGEVWVNVTVSDESPLTSTSLEYSLDDGETWARAITRDLVGDTYIFSLRTLYDSYVSLRFNATDSYGNRVSQSTIRSFRVKDLGNLNDDRKVDGKDLAIVCRAFNTRPGQPLWDYHADTNLDSKVDGLDVAMVASHFGRNW